MNFSIQQLVAQHSIHQQLPGFEVHVCVLGLVFGMRNAIFHAIPFDALHFHQKRESR